MSKFSLIKIASAFLIGTAALSASASVQDEIAIWEKAGFLHPEIVILKTHADTFSKKYTHELTMSLVLLRSPGEIFETVTDVINDTETVERKLKISGWTTDVTQKSIKRVAEIYSQCGIKVDNVKLITIDAPKDMTTFESYRQMLTNAPKLTLPTVFLIKGRLDEHDGEPSAGHAYRNGMIDAGDVIRDTAWIAGIINTDYYKNLRQEGYSPMAHELAHLVMDAGHIDFDDGMNLLGPTAETVNSEIRRSQCEDMKKHPSVKEIQARNPSSVNMTESDFNTAIDEIAEMLRPAVESHNVNFLVEKKWNSNKDDASVDQEIKKTWSSNEDADPKKLVWSLVVFGGLGRHPEVTKDVLQLVVCHEMGHLLGGYPFVDYGAEAASEGQADTFATQVCLPMAWMNQKETNKKFRTSVDPYAKKMCDKSWTADDRRDLCYRTAVASFHSAIWLADGGVTDFPLPGDPPIAFNTPDPTEPSSTITSKNYSIQCRLDSMFQGSLCDARFDIYKIPGLGFPNGAREIDAEKEAAKYSCTNTKDGEIHLARPRCWYVPRNLKEN